MLTERQFLILNVCADDWEIFYFPFAEVNYGGQILPKDADASLPRHVGDQPWQATVPAEAIAADLVVLVAQGLLQCARFDYPGDIERKMLKSVGVDDLSIYSGYSCLTFEDHIETYGYGPFEFYITQAGIREVKAPEYASWFPQTPSDR